MDATPCTSSVSSRFSAGPWFESDVGSETTSGERIEGGDGRKGLRQIHPGSVVHASMAYLVLYNMLHVLVNHCHGRAAYTAPPDRTHDAYKHEPLPKPRGLPPPLTSNTTLYNVDLEWRKASAKAHAYTSPARTVTPTPNVNCDSQNQDPCLLSWIGGMDKANDRKKLTSLIASSFDDVYYNGWIVVDDRGKVGLAPVVVDAPPPGGNPPNRNQHVQFYIHETRQRVRVLNVLVMKSYGEDWMDSRIRVEVSVSAPSKSGTATGDATTDGEAKSMRVVVNEEVTGFHHSNTSIPVPYTFSLNEGIGADTDANANANANERGIPRGSRVMISMEMMGGKKFKVMGMSLC